MDQARRLAAKWRHWPFHPQWLLGRRRPPAGLESVAGVVLDVGCADRWIEPLLGDSARYLGVDLPVTGRDMYGARPHAYADAAALPIASGCVDAVVCLEVLEHVRDPSAALAELARVLRPDGRAYLSMPFLYPIHDAPFDFQRLTEHGLARDLDRAGFDLVRLERTGHAASAACLLLNLALVGGLARGGLRLVWTPFVLVSVLGLNLAGALLSRVFPDWPALCTGYVVEARKRQGGVSESPVSRSAAGVRAFSEPT